MKPRNKDAGTQRLKDLYAAGGDEALMQDAIAHAKECFHVCRMDYTSEEHMAEETFKKLKARIA